MGRIAWMVVVAAAAVGGCGVGFDGSSTYYLSACDEGACDDMRPIGQDAECHGTQVNTTTNECIRYTFDDGDVCMRGVGHCERGACIYPRAADEGRCDALVLHDQQEGCANDSDCDDGNACTIDECPAPGCLPCQHRPVMNGTQCMTFGQAAACAEGACCLPVQ